MVRDQLIAEIGRRKWFQTLEAAPGVFTPGLYRPEPERVFSLLGAPNDMRGKRCLDMACADGAMSFEMARRGGGVTAVDLMAPRDSNIDFLNSVFGLNVRYEQSTVYAFDQQPFDIVICFGLLYHLQHPLLGLQNLNRLCRGALFLESHIEYGWRNVCRFYPGRELNRDPSNWWGPTKQCLHAMVESAGFEIETARFYKRHRHMLRARKVRDAGPALGAREVIDANWGPSAP